MGCLRVSTLRAWRLARRPSHNIAGRVDLPLPRAPYGTDGYSSENLFNELNTEPSGTPCLYLIKCIHVNKQSDIQDLNDTNTCPLMAT